MSGFAFIFADIMVWTGTDPWQAHCIETMLLAFLLAPIVVGAPMLLAKYDAWKRDDNARIRAAKHRRMERTAR